MAAIYDAKIFNPDNGIGRLLGRVKMAMHEALERELAPLDITAAQFVIILNHDNWRHCFRGCSLMADFFTQFVA